MSGISDGMMSMFKLMFYFNDLYQNFLYFCSGYVLVPKCLRLLHGARLTVLTDAILLKRENKPNGRITQSH